METVLGLFVIIARPSRFGLTHYPAIGTRPGLVLRDKMQASLLPKKRQQKTAPSKLILRDIMLEGSNSLLPKTTNNCLKLNLREYRVVVN